ncbi:taste receptor type 2 member 4-like [Aquarana catesbeiana]|uniref:taste receptor type 2 member 4-like n=1 Tax=Aquarana catesbeiana TaxID=8400 RepID=UPI003CCA22AB
MEWSTIIPITIGAPGFTLNLLILILYLRDWYKGKHPTACDRILSTMTFTNMFYQCVLIAEGLIRESNTTIQKAFCLYDDLISSIIVYTSFWQTALLSTYYCVKLFNFPHHLFQWVKKIISTSTNLLLLGLAVFCFLINLPFIWTVASECPENVTEPTRVIDDIVVSTKLLYLFNVMLGCCLPFTLTFTCITLSVGSLLKHAWNIRRNALQLRSPPQIGGLLRAAGTMAACVLLDLVCSVEVVGQLISNYNSGDVKIDTLYWVIVTLYPTGRSIVLIIGTPQLKKQLGEMCVYL